MFANTFMCMSVKSLVHFLVALHMHFIVEMGGRNRALHRSAMFQLSDKLSQQTPSENYSKIPS